MPLHDCNTCDKKELCPLVDIAPWLNEHEAEVDGVLKSVTEVAGKAADPMLQMFDVSCDNLVAHLLTIQLVAVLQAIFLIGYQGRVIRQIDFIGTIGNQLLNIINTVAKADRT